MRTQLIIIFLLINSSYFAQSKGYLKANYLFDQGNYSEAIIELEKSLGHKKNSNLLGLIHFQLGECNRILDDSITTSHYVNCIHFSKTSYHSISKKEKYDRIRRLTFSYFYTGSQKEALLWVDRCLKANPEDCEVQKLKTYLSTNE